MSRRRRQINTYSSKSGSTSANVSEARPSVNDLERGNERGELLEEEEGRENHQQVEEKEEDLFGDLERTVVQAFMASPCASEEEVKQMLQKIHQVIDHLDVSVADSDVRETISKVNEGIEPLNLKIVAIRDQMIEAKVHYVFINTNSNVATKLATQYTVDEIEFFKALIDYIFIDGQSSTKTFYNVRQADLAKCDAKLERRLGASMRDQLIVRFLDDKWLDKSLTDPSTTGYELGVRTLSEMRNYLLEIYGPEGTNTLRLCKACEGIFTRGRKCGSENCTVVLHEACTQAYFLDQGNLCPSCQGDLASQFIKIGCM